MLAKEDICCTGALEFYRRNPFEPPVPARPPARPPGTPARPTKPFVLFFLSRHVRVRLGCGGASPRGGGDDGGGARAVRVIARDDRLVPTVPMDQVRVQGFGSPPVT
jgi:hypothetical protein